MLCPRRPDVDVRAGNEHTSKHSAPGLWALLDRTARDCWPTLLRGDASFAPVLRAVTRRGLARAGQPVDQPEDIVQDILLALHLKRQTWDADALFSPWLFSIARNKLVDALRRRGRRVFVNIDDFTETIASEPVAETVTASELIVHLKGLPNRQRDVLQSITVESNSIKATAAKLAMSEGAVRVALHRGLAKLAAKLRNE